MRKPTCDPQPHPRSTSPRLRTLREPARFVCWQMPATLDDKISALSRTAQAVDDPQRRTLLMEYRRHFESLNDHAAPFL